MNRKIAMIAGNMLASVLSSVQGADAEAVAHRSLRVQLPGQEHNVIKTSWPGVGCWFMARSDFEADGFKRFIDLHALHSGYGLLTTSIRHGVEVTQPEVHDQLKRAAVYARAHGLGMVLDLDVRLARQAFMARHPGEMQELARLREVALLTQGDVTLAVDAMKLTDHYSVERVGMRPFETISARLVRAYSYVAGPDGIDPATIQEITARCRVMQADARGFRAVISCTEADRGRTACLLVALTLFTPDVFAPHLTAFERAILEQYADIPLVGACKDEWGFPGRFTPRLDDLYYSESMAKAYAQRRPGRDLVRDMLLMLKPHREQDGDRIAAINHYMEMIWQRNAEVENAFYASTKAVFGPQAMVGTHPTWYPNPATRQEVFKNGLHWWGVRRDLAQTDEGTPYCVRTALSKKWHSPLWMNMYYERSLQAYKEDIWRHLLGGGRMNFHPVYPRPADAPADARMTSLLDHGLQIADCRIRLLNYISSAPIDCPVAVVFGHPSALNWAGSGLADTGLALTDLLWADGHYTDLIPSSEIASGALVVGEDGRVRYGAQCYEAVVFYRPQFERAEVAAFFRQAAAGGRTSLYRIGEWTRDFEGRVFDGAHALPAAMRTMPDAATCARTIISELDARGGVRQTRSTARSNSGFPSSMAPLPNGQCRLLDGTIILASGGKDVQGDPIQTAVAVRGREVRFDAVGVAAVRMDDQGRVTAMAAGGLKHFAGGDLSIELPERVDVALWRNADGAWQGVWQGPDGPVPEPLTRITDAWKHVRLPIPWPGRTQ